jgi:hypothetical protein
VGQLEGFNGVAKPVNQPLFELKVLDTPNLPADDLTADTQAFHQALENTQYAKAALNQRFTKALLVDFKNFGAEAIVRLREKNPAQYVKIIKDFLPKELTIDVNQRDDATSQSVDLERLRLLRELITRSNGDGRVIDGTARSGSHLSPADEGTGTNGPVLPPDPRSGS